MNTRVIIFVVTLVFVTGLVVGYSIHKPNIKPEICETTKPSQRLIRDTVVKIKTDTIVIQKAKYFTKTDTVFVNNEPVVNDSVKCISYPILLSDSSKISITQCSSEKFPENIDYDARYIDKRERIRIVETVRNDTIRLDAHVKRLGFTLGPSAGIGIDVNNIKQPVYFIGATLTYGWRF